VSAPRILGVALAASALFGLGCSVPLEGAPVPGQVNACSGSSGCADGATCLEGICVATDFDLTGLLLEVRPRTNASFGANTSYFFDLADTSVPLLAHGPSVTPFNTHLPLQLPQPFSVVGGRVRVNHDTPLEPSCLLDADRAIPAHLTFYRVPKFAGLPSDPVPATAAKNGASTTFAVDLVPGTYDVYVEPQMAAGCNSGNVYPPAFFPGQQIGVGGAPAWELPELPRVGHLTATITGFGKDAPAAFTADLLEPGRGQPISSNAVLTAIDGGYTVTLDTAWQPSPILRLTPTIKPGDPLQATVYWALSGSPSGGTQLDPTYDFTVEHLYSTPVKMSGQVRGTDDFTGVAATITIQSTALPGPDAENAAVTVQSLPTDAQGGFTVYLPPGSYKFRAFPIDNGLAVTDRDFTVPADATCFCGQPFPLFAKLSLGGAVKTPTGERLASALVNITPSTTLSSSYWINAHTLAPLTARPVTATTDGDGKFTLLVDSGSSDLTVVAGAGSSFPWLVRPRLTVQTASELASLMISSPALLSGVVADPGNAPVADAEINAWFPVRDPAAPGGLTGVAVKIGTTSTDASGGYSLVLPSSI
jgi:hypothetical protein